LQPYRRVLQVERDANSLRCILFEPKMSWKDSDMYNQPKASKRRWSAGRDVI
jgi:hypothetical protein